MTNGSDRNERTCIVDGCDKPTRSKSADLCKMHYHRQYRHGSVAKVATGIQTGYGRRYRKVSRPGHPLAHVNGQVYVHRAVLYDKIGPGPHECFWCGRSIEWMSERAPNRLEPDHLNGQGDDNRIENLVPSCPRCNSVRGNQHRAAALRAAGFWSVNDTVAHLTNGGRIPPIEGVV